MKKITFTILILLLFTQLKAETYVTIMKEFLQLAFMEKIKK